MAPKKKKEKEPQKPAEEAPRDPVEEDVAASPEPELPKEPPRDPVRGYVGNVFQGVFADLYQPPPETAPDTTAAAAVQEAGAPEEPATDPSSPPDRGGDRQGPSFEREDAEIEAIRRAMEAEEQRVDGVARYLKDKTAQALGQDREYADHLQARWGLTLNDQVPVPESNFRSVIDPSLLKEDGLTVPREMLADVEHKIELSKGTVLKHDNLLAISKPGQPNHLRNTAGLQIRSQVRNIHPTLTNAQRTAIGGAVEEKNRRRPPAQATLNTEEQLRNLEIARRMHNKINFLKNPRFNADRTEAKKGEPCPFAINPEEIVFRGYDPGGIYELDIEFRNRTKYGRSLRAKPPKSPAFAIGALRHDASQHPGAGNNARENSVIAPGMAAKLQVRFAPQTLNDVTDEILVSTDYGDYKVPVMARRAQPRLVIGNPVECGCIIAGGVTTVLAQIRNHGGEGSFRLIAAPATAAAAGGEAEAGGAEECQYMTEDEGQTTLVTEMFRVYPASFYMEANQTIDLEVTFTSTKVGKHQCRLLIECDSSAVEPLTLVGITDALRLGLSQWPTLPSEVQASRPVPGASVWSLLPWRLNWLNPGVQVGCTAAQSISITNSGHMPAEVEWRFARPPRGLVSRLMVGGIQRLTEDILRDVHTWPSCGPPAQGKEGGCPFIVTPVSQTLPPFSTAAFSFSFRANGPAGHREISFAYLVAKRLPAGGHCLLRFEQLMDLHDERTAQPSSGGGGGLPLAGGAIGPMFDLQPGAAEAAEADARLGLPPPRLQPPATASCSVTAICLQGMTIGPRVTLGPRALILSGDSLPYVAHQRELRLQNTGGSAAYFRVRLSSIAPLTSRSTVDPLWVIGAHEAGPVPLAPDVGSPETELTSAARKLAAQWPCLPPEGAEAQGQPGYGALAVACVEPHEGQVLPGATVTLRITLRALREFDLSSQIVVDLPYGPGEQAAAAPALKAAVMATIRAPSVELRHTSLLDYGVVRAHGRHTRRLSVHNPSALPMLLRLRHLKDGGAEPPGDAGGGADDAEAEAEAEVEAAEVAPTVSFPVGSHVEVVNMFLDSAKRGALGASKAIDKGPLEAFVQPWVHTRDGCLDKSGRKKFAKGEVYEGRRKLASSEMEERGLDDDEDFIFRPSMLVLWPQQTAEVEVTLRTAGQGKYRALLEASSYDAMRTQCIEVWAEVQLPKIRLSTQHARFETAYLRQTTQPFELQIRNDADMPAVFRWEVPALELASGLEVQIGPNSGEVPPLGVETVTLVAVPTQQLEVNELTCKLFIQDVLQALTLRVSAKVYGPEVDYAVVAPGSTAPSIRHQPRSLDTHAGSTHPVMVGQAPHGSPVIDFGVMELQKSKIMQVVLYNRTAIATTFAVHVNRNPAYDPLEQARPLADVLDVATRLCNQTYAPDTLKAVKDHLAPYEDETRPQSKQTGSRPGSVATTVKQSFSTLPEPASYGRVPSRESKLRSKKFEPKPRRSTTRSVKSLQGTSTKRKQRWLLDDKHEKQAFRGSTGDEFAKHKEQREAGVSALRVGRGWAVKVEPNRDWLRPFSKAVITLTCFSDLPGMMEDELCVNIQQMESHEGRDFRIPMRLRSYGNPLYLPGQQVALNEKADPPELLCGTITPIEKLSERRFKVGNNSAVKMRIAWQVLPKIQVESMAPERNFVNVALCRRPGGADPLEGQPGNYPSPAEEDEDDEGIDDGEEQPFSFHMWADHPPEVPDPYTLQPGGELPIRIEPEEAVVPAYGTASFKVTLTGSRTTFSAQQNYCYHLVGKGRAAEGRAAAASAAALPEAGAEAAAEARAPSQVSGKSAAAKPSLHDRFDDSSSDEDALMEELSVAATSARVVEAAYLSAAVSPEPEAQGGRLMGRHLARPLIEEPEAEVLSTLVVECVGDCVLPRLTVDKKGNPGVEDLPDTSEDVEPRAAAQVNCPTFKFLHAVVQTPQGMQAQEDESLNRPARTCGATLGAVPGGSQRAGVTSCLVRTVSLTNYNACSVTCRFRVQGPFRVRQVDQAGQHPVRASNGGDGNKTKRKGEKPGIDPLQRFVVPRDEIIALQVEFMHEMVKATQPVAEQVVEGDITVEYPRGNGEDGGERSVDAQRIHLMGSIRRPVVKLHLVPSSQDQVAGPERPLQPPWGEPEVMLVEFGFVHVETSVSARRVFLLANETNAFARWSLVHVGRKRRAVPETGLTVREEEDLRALDDMEAFEFDVCKGQLRGPTKDGKVPGSHQRVPHYCPTSSALPQKKGVPGEDEFEPQRVTVTFKPRKNELYKCRFRIQVEEGPSIDFVCRGCGSYDEEDDGMHFHEA